MKIIRVGTGIINPTVGAVDSNARKIARQIDEMGQVDFACFPEMCVIGYPAEDLVQWEGLLETQFEAIEQHILPRSSKGKVIIIGVAISVSDRLYNAAAVIFDGEIVGIVPKEHLPTYDVFYERRVFSAGVPGHVEEDLFGDLIFELMPMGFIFSTSVCEGSWQHDGPIPRRAYGGAVIHFNLSASPWRLNVVDRRMTLLSNRSADNETVLVYTNQVGGNDGLVFDGGGYVYQNGALVGEAPRFEEGVSVFGVDVQSTILSRQMNSTWGAQKERWTAGDGPKSQVIQLAFDHRPAEKPLARQKASVESNLGVSGTREKPNFYDDMRLAQQMGLGDYYDKVGKFSGIAIAESGGRDSFLTTLLVAEWAKKRGLSMQAGGLRVVGVTMPSGHNSPVTVSIAREVCSQTGVEFYESSIQDEYEREVKALKKLLGKDELKPLTLQNIQARIRSSRMWNISNEEGLLWIQCGNMTEKSVGYTTMGGDLEGSFSLLNNMPKTFVNGMIDRYQEVAASLGWPEMDVLISRLKATKASAELADDQDDERDLMPFEILDLCCHEFLSGRRTPQELYDILMDRYPTTKALEVVMPGYQPGDLKRCVQKYLRLFFGNVFKWVQSPMGVHMNSVDLDRERALQIPVVTSLEWLRLGELVGEA